MTVSRSSAETDARCSPSVFNLNGRSPSASRLRVRWEGCGAYRSTYRPQPSHKISLWSDVHMLGVATCAYNLYIQEYVQTTTFPNKFPLEVATCAYNLYIQEYVQTATFLQDSESWRTFFRTVCPGNQGLRCFIVMPNKVCWKR